MRTTANGKIATLEAHGFTARIASVGAALAGLEFRGRPLVRPFDTDRARPVYSGALLAPWPNRVVDGRYGWQGREHQLALTEPARGHALHGLAANTDFTVTAEDASSLRLAALLPAQEGYPFALELAVEFRLDQDGLRTLVTAANIGRDTAPLGWGSHSYLLAPGRPEDWVLTLPAAAVQETRGERLLPGRLVPVEQFDHGALDFRAPRALGQTFIDHAYTRLQADSSGLFHASVTDAQGVGAQITWDEACRWVQVHTADRPEPELDRTGLALEPMTCPPDAFNSHQDLIALEPGASHQASWLIGPVQPR